MTTKIELKKLFIFDTTFYLSHFHTNCGATLGYDLQMFTVNKETLRGISNGLKLILGEAHNSLLVTSDNVKRPNGWYAFVDYEIPGWEVGPEVINFNYRRNHGNIAPIVLKGMPFEERPQKSSRYIRWIFIEFTKIYNAFNEDSITYLQSYYQITDSKFYTKALSQKFLKNIYNIYDPEEVECMFTNLQEQAKGKYTLTTFNQWLRQYED